MCNRKASGAGAPPLPHPLTCLYPPPHTHASAQAAQWAGCPLRPPPAAAGPPSRQGAPRHGESTTLTMRCSPLPLRRYSRCVDACARTCPLRGRSERGSRVAGAATMAALARPLRRRSRLQVPPQPSFTCCRCAHMEQRCLWRRQLVLARGPLGQEPHSRIAACTTCLTLTRPVSLGPAQTSCRLQGRTAGRGQGRGGGGAGGAARQAWARGVSGCPPEAPAKLGVTPGGAHTAKCCQGPPCVDVSKPDC